MEPAGIRFKIRKNTFDAVIFDMDGVVTRTARLHAAAWKKLFDEYLRDLGTRSAECPTDRA